MNDFMRKHEERLARLAQDAKNSILEKAKDGYIKITIPNIGVVTWAENVEDAKIAITEAIEAFKIVANKHGQGFQKELEIMYKDVDNSK
jgi:ribulose-5-phosphate 4-epimerase/fuculose-1-phosphate aldolase